MWEFINIIWAPSSEFVSSSIPSWQILTAHAQPFRGTRDLAFCLKVPLDSLLVWASSGGSGETVRMRRLAWNFAARIGDKYQIPLTRSISWLHCDSWIYMLKNTILKMWKMKMSKNCPCPWQFQVWLVIYQMSMVNLAPTQHSNHSTWEALDRVASTNSLLLKEHPRAFPNSHRLSPHHSKASPRTWVHPLGNNSINLGQMKQSWFLLIDCILKKSEKFGHPK